jgi:hypothetical protein
MAPVSTPWDSDNVSIVQKLLEAVAVYMEKEGLKPSIEEHNSKDTPNGSNRGAEDTQDGCGGDGQPGSLEEVLDTEDTGGRDERDIVNGLNSENESSRQ